MPTYQEAEIDFGMTPFFVVEGQEDFVDTWTAPGAPSPTARIPRMRHAWSWSSWPPRGSGSRWRRRRIRRSPPSVAEEAGYGDDDPIKQEFLPVLENARPLVFAPPGVETGIRSR